MGHAPQYTDANNSEDAKTILGDRRNNHSAMVRFEIPMPSPFQDRDGVIRSLWKKLDENTYFVSQVPCEHVEFPESAEHVRMHVRRNFKLTKISPRLTLFEGSASINLRGSLPRSINDAVTIPTVVNSSDAVLMYFMCVRPAVLFDEGDATTLGRLLFARLRPHRKNRDTLNEKILEMIRMTNVLRSAQAKYR
jgi:hypothetical protein